jgi:hypothetical protein
MTAAEQRNRASAIWTDADANGLAKPRMTACRSRHAEDGKYVGANPSPIEGGYSP